MSVRRGAIQVPIDKSKMKTVGLSSSDFTNLVQRSAARTSNSSVLNLTAVKSNYDKPKLPLFTLVSNDITDTSIRITWKTVSFEYDISYITHLGATVTQRIAANTNFLHASGLNPSTNYTFTIKPITPNPNDIPVILRYQTLRDRTIVDISPISPTITTKSIKLNYSKPSGTTGVIVYYRVYPSGKYILGGVDIDTFNNLESSTEYEFYALSYTGDTQSPQSSPVRFTTLSNTINNLVVSAPTAYSVQLTYSIPAGVDSVRVYYKAEGAENPIFQESSQVISTISGLIPNTKYQIYAASVTGVNVSLPSSTIQFSTLRNTINDLVVSDPTLDSVRLSYSIPPGVNSVRVYYKPDGVVLYTMQESSQVISSLSGLTPNTSYQIYAVSVTGTNVSDIFRYLQFKTANSNVEDLRVSSITSSTAIVSHSKPPGTDSVRVYYRPTGGTYTGGTALTTLSGLAASTTYQIYAVSVTGNTESPTPAPTQFTTLSNAVTNLTVSDVRGSKAKVSYSGPSGVDSVRVYYRPTGGTYTYATNPTELSGLSPSTTYDIYAVSVTNNVVSPTPAPTQFTTLSNAVDTFTVGLVTTNSVAISYSVPYGTDHVMVYYRVKGGNEYNFGRGIKSLTGLTPSTTYQIYAVSITGNTESAKPTPIEFTTLAVLTIIYPRVQNLNVSSITSSTATVSYSRPTGIDSVRVYYRPTGGSYTYATDPTALSGLAASTTYDIYAVSVINNVLSPTPTPIQFTTLSNAVENFAWGSVTSSTVLVSYRRPTGVDSVRVYYRPTGGSYTYATDPTELSGLAASTTYDVYAVSVTNNVVSPTPALTQFTTLSNAVENLTATLTATTATLSYTRPPGTDSVKVYYRPTGGSYTGGTPLTTLSELSPSTTYDIYAVSVTNNIVSPTPTPIQFTTLSNAVENFAWGSVTSSTVLVSYRRPTGVDSVRVYYRPTGGSYTYATNPTELSGLAASTTYDVYAVSVTNNVVSPTPALTQFTTLSNAVTNFGLISGTLTSTTATLSYTRPTGVDSIRLYSRPIGGTYIPISYTPGTNSMGILGLTPSTTYQMYAVSVTGLIQSPAPAPIEFTTQAEAVVVLPSVNLTVTSVTASSAIFSYPPPTGVDSVRVYYRVSGDFTYQSDRGITRLSGLSPSTTYQIYAVTVRGNDESPVPIPTEFTTLTQAVAVSPPITDFQLGDATATSITFSYSRPNNIDSVKIYYRLYSSDEWTTAFDVTIISELIPNFTYEIYAVSVTGSIESPKPAFISRFTTLDGVGIEGSPPVTDFSVLYSTHNSVTVSYTLPPGAGSVQVGYKRLFVRGDPPYTFLRNPRIISGLTPSTWYQFDAYSLTNGVYGYPDRPAIWISTTAGPNVIPNICDLKLISVAYDSITISYTKPPGMKAVHVSYGVNDFTETETDITTILGLASSTRYRIRLITEAPDGTMSPPTDRIFATTSRSPVFSFPPVTGLRTSYVTNRSAVISYTRPSSGIDSVRVYYRPLGGSYTYATNVNYLSGLSPSTTYDVYAVSVRGNIEAPAPTPRRFTTRPATVGIINPVISDFQLLSITSSSAILSYTQPDDTDWVGVYYRSSLTDPYTFGVNIRKLENLRFSTVHYVYIVPVRNNIEINPTVPIEFYTLSPLVTNVRVPRVTLTTTSAIVSYTRPSGVDSVLIYYKPDVPGSSYISQEDAQISGLTPSTTYMVYAVSVTNSIQSPPTLPIYFTTSALTVAPIQGGIILDLQATSVTENSITVSYTPYAAGKHHTIIFYRPVGSIDPYRSCAADTELFVESGVTRARLNINTLHALTPSTAYEIYVTTKFIIETATPQDPRSDPITISTLPSFETIDDLTVKSVTANSATIHYTKPDAAESVRVYYKKSTSSTYRSALDIRNLSNLESSSVYNVYVSSIVGNNVYSPSKIRTFRTLDVSEVVHDLAIQYVTHNSAKIAYSIPNGRTSVKVYYKVDAVGSSLNHTTLKEISGLTPSTRYQMYAVSLNGSEESAPSGTIFFTTLGPSEIPMKLLTPINSQNFVTPFVTSVRYVVPKPLNCVSYDVEIEQCDQ